MHGTDFHGASTSFAALGRSLLSIRRDQAPPPDPPPPSSALDLELDSFQRHVSDLLLDLSSSPDLLSLPFLRRLLDSFLICQEQFRSLLSHHRPSRPSLSDFLDRSLKALDLCNALRDGVDLLRSHLSPRLDIVVSSLSAPLSEPRALRAKKALADISLLLLDDPPAPLPRRNRSFGRHHHHAPPKAPPSAARHVRSLSWSVSKAWSASRQLQAIAGGLAPPRANEIAASGGLAAAVFTMSSVLFFVVWAAVAAIPCQDRGVQAHLSIPRGYAWAAPVMSMHERITEEAGRRERRGSAGLLREMYRIERTTRRLMELIDVVQFPLPEEREVEVREAVKELAQVRDELREGLDPLERQLREVFRRIVRSRSEGMDCLGPLPTS